jgi:TRAP-type transport system periplasmic protein
MTHRRLALMTVIVLLAARAVSAQTVTWSMADEYPATSIQGEADVRFAREVSRRTGGRIEIAHQFDASSGFRSREMMDAVGRGAVSIGNIYMGALGGVDPVFLLPSLPFLATTPEQGQALAAVARPHYERVLTKHNHVLLFQSPWPPAGIWANKPVGSAEALRGLRIRTADANGVLAFRAAGAVPVAISFTDALPQLQSGQLDAVLSSGDGGAGAWLMETLRHFTAIEYAVTMSVVTINGDAWRGLDAGTQHAVRAAAAESKAQQWEAMKTRVAENYARMRAAGVGLTTELSIDYQQSLRKAGRAAVDDWLRQMGPAGSQILDAYRARLAGR